MKLAASPLKIKNSGYLLAIPFAFASMTAFAQTDVQVEEPFEEDAGQPFIVADEQYTYPKLKGDLATICSPAVHVPDSEVKTLSVRVLKHAPESGYIHVRNKLEVDFYPSAHKTDEVVLVIGGLGAKTNSIFSRFYAQKAQELGLNALVFPNTMTDDIILT
jgi:hypothetical protein